MHANKRTISLNTFLISSSKSWHENKQCDLFFILINMDVRANLRGTSTNPTNTEINDHVSVEMKSNWGT